MRINIYAEELPTERRVERVETTADTGRTFYGARVYLVSPKELHDEPGDDDRSAITFWGPRAKVVKLLRELADVMEYSERPTQSFVVTAHGCGWQQGDSEDAEPTDTSVARRR